MHTAYEHLGFVDMHHWQQTAEVCSKQGIGVLICILSCVAFVHMKGYGSACESCWKLHHGLLHDQLVHYCKITADLQGVSRGLVSSAVTSSLAM